MPWYVFQTNGTNPSDPNQYGPPQITAPTCPGDNLFLCAIQANDNMGHPHIDCTLIIEIAIAIQNRTDSINVKLRPTK